MHKSIDVSNVHASFICVCMDIYMEVRTHMYVCRQNYISR